MKREYPKKPIPAVGVVVLKENSVLLIKRNKPPKEAQWSIPGGAQDVGETLQNAGIREVMEETGVSFKNIELLDALDFIDRDENNDVRYHYSLIDFVADYNDGELKAGDDAIDARWVLLNDLDEYNLWSDTLRVIKKAAHMRNKN